MMNSTQFSPMGHHSGTSGKSGAISHAIIPIIGIFLVLTYLAVALRLFNRKRYVKFIGWDDYLIIGSLVSFTVFCAGSIAMFILSHDASSIDEIPHEDTRNAIKILLVTETFYILTMILLKLSLAVFFLRILASTWQRWLIVFTTCLSTAFGVVYLFFAIFQCGWVKNVDIFLFKMIHGQCAAKSIGIGINYTYASLATLSDWTCGILPVFILKGSNMPTRSKFVVCGLLAFASIGSVASIVRMAYLDSITVPTGSFFHNISKLAIWSTIEPGVGITVASLATMRRLFQRIFRDTKAFGSRSRQNSYATAGSGAGGGLGGGRPNGGLGRVNPAGSMALNDVGGLGLEMDKKAPEEETRRLDSNATTLAMSPVSPSSTVAANTSMGNGSAGRERERSMADEMKAYGISDWDDVGNVNEGDLDATIPVDVGSAERRGSQFVEQRVFVPATRPRVVTINTTVQEIDPDATSPLSPEDATTGASTSEAGQHLSVDEGARDRDGSVVSISERRAGVHRFVGLNTDLNVG